MPGPEGPKGPEVRMFFWGANGLFHPTHQETVIRSSGAVETSPGGRGIAIPKQIVAWSLGKRCPILKNWIEIDLLFYHVLSIWGLSLHTLGTLPRFIDLRLRHALNAVYQLFEQFLV